MFVLEVSLQILPFCPQKLLIYILSWIKSHIKHSMMGLFISLKDLDSSSAGKLQNAIEIKFVNYVGIHVFPISQMSYQYFLLTSPLMKKNV